MAAGTTVNLKLLIQATNTASKEVQRLQGQFNELSRGAAKLGERSAKGAREATKGMKDLTSSTKDFSTQVKKAKEYTEGFGVAGIALLGVAASLSATTFFPVKSAADFEQSLSKVVAVTGGAVEKFNELKDVASELGRTTKFTATEAAQGMVFLGQAGFDANEVISGIGPSLQLAVAAGVDLATAADIATNVVSAMRLQVDDLSIAVDILANTTASANTNLIQLADAMKYAGPLAAASGIRLEDLAAAMGVLGNNGIQASMAGTAVRGMLRALTSPTTIAKQKLDELGITIKTSADGSLDFIDALAQLAEAQLTAADANAIFGRFAAAGALAISANINELYDLVDSNDAAAGAALRMSKVMKDNVKGAFTELLSAVDGLKRAFGDPLLGPIRSVVENMTSLVGILTSVAEKMPVTISLLGKLSIVTIAATAAIAGLAFAVNGLNTALTLLAGTAMANAIKGMFRFGGIVGVVTGVVKKLWMLLRAHPLIALGTVLLGVVAYYNELAASVTRLTNEARANTAEFERLRAVYDRQVTALMEMEEGSKKAVATAKNLREQLLDTAKKTRQLATEATRAATSIDEMSGKITDGGEALKEFVEASKELAAVNMVKQVNLLNDQLDRETGKLKDLVFWINTYNRGWDGILSTIIPGGRTWNDVVQEGVERTRLLTAQVEAANRATIKLFTSWGEFDPAMSAQEAEEYFRLLQGLSEERAKALAEINDTMRGEAQSTRDVQRELEGMTLDEVKESIKSATKEVNLMGEAYDNIASKSRAAATRLSSLSEYERKHAADLKKQVEELLTERAKTNSELTSRESELNEQLLGLRKKLTEKTKKEYDEQLKVHKRAKELGYIAEWQYNNAVADLNEKRARQERANITTLQNAIMEIRDSSVAELPIAETIAKSIEKADRKVTDTSQASKDARIKHANEVKNAVIAAEREASSIRIDLMEDGVEKFRKQRDQEIKILQEDAKRRGIEWSKMAGLEKAIRDKYKREEDVFESDRQRKVLEAEYRNTQEINKMKFDENERAFRDREISAKTYAQRNIALQRTMLNEELALVRDALERAEQLGEDHPVVVKLRYDIERLEAKAGKLKTDEPKVIEEAKLREKIIRGRIDEEITANELNNMDIRYESMREMADKRLDLLKTHQQNRLLAMEAAGAKEKELLRQQNADEVEMERAKEEEKRAIREQALSWGVEMASTAEDAFAGMYEQSGQKDKAWFYAQKAAAIARVTMSTAVAIMRAYELMGPYAGSIMAGLLILKGSAQIAKIRAAKYGEFSEGGEVQGKSPHKKADNIRAWLTAKEFVQPVDTVKYYGKEVMEGLRRRVIPKEIFEGYRLPTPAIAYAGRTHFAKGGEAVMERADKMGKKSSYPVAAPPQPISIINVIDPNEMDRYLSSSSGQNAVLNVLSSRGETVKRILK